jgi:hypothetical protein
VLLFESAEPPERAVDLVLGVLADAACVEQNGVGRLGLVDQLVALISQAGDYELAIEHVHLTTDGFDVDVFRHSLPSFRHQYFELRWFLGSRFGGSQFRCRPTIP